MFSEEDDARCVGSKVVDGRRYAKETRVFVRERRGRKDLSIHKVRGRARLIRSKV